MTEKKRGARHLAREAALRVLYQCDISGEPVESALRSVLEGTLADADDLVVGEQTRRFVQGLVRGVDRRRKELDQLIRDGSEHWRLERMAAVDRNVLRLALFELFDEPDTPAAVILDEAIELAKLYGGPESGAFVNGVVDGIRRRLATGELVRQ